MRVLLSIAVFAVLAGCSKKEAQIAAPLAFVPTDTPYLFANLEPMPVAATERMQRYGSAGKEVMAELFQEALRDLREKAGDQSPEQLKNQEMVFKLLEALLGEAVVLDSPDAMRKAGLKPQPMVALYGVGAVPVYRVEISDGKLLNATFERVFNKAGISFTREPYGDGYLLRLGKEKLQMVIAVVGGHAVFSLAPAAAKADLLALIAPLQAGDGAALTAKLKQLQQSNGYTSFGSGYLEPAKVMNFMLAKPNALEAALMALGGKAPPKMSDVCQSELRGLLSKVPRITAGWSEFTAQHWDSKTVIELSPEIAKELSQVRAPLPDYGKGTLMKFGFAINTLAAANFARTQASLVTAAPYKCEQLQDLNESMAKLKENASNPSIGMAAVVQGFGLSIDSLELPGGKLDADFDPKGIKGNIALFSTQPLGLVSLLGGYVPALAKLGLKDDSVPVAITPELLAEIGNPKLADLRGAALMTKGMVLVGFGEDRMTALGLLAKAKTPALGPVLEVGYGKELLALSLQQAELAAAKLEGEEAEKMRRMLNMQKTMLQQIKNIHLQLSIDNTGIIMHQRVALN